MQRVCIAIHAEGSKRPVRLPTTPFYLSRPYFQPQTVVTRYHSRCPSALVHPPRLGPPHHRPPSSQTPLSAASISTPCSVDPRARTVSALPCCVSYKQRKDNQLDLQVELTSPFPRLPKKQCTRDPHSFPQPIHLSTPYLRSKKKKKKKKKKEKKKKKKNPPPNPHKTKKTPPTTF